jgi:hypothetical protein
MTLIGVKYGELAFGVLAIFLFGMVVAARAIISRIYGPSESPTAMLQLGDKLVAKLSSKGLASVIVQALVDSKILDKNKADEAVLIAAQNIDLRKALGDY